MTDYYLDFDSLTDGVGTIGDPFNLLATAEATIGGGDTLYIKRGTEQSETNMGFYVGADNITIDAYGTGADPILHTFFYIVTLDGWVIQNVQQDATTLTGSNKNYAIMQESTCNNNTYKNLTIYGGFNNVSNHYYGTNCLWESITATGMVNGGIGLEATASNPPNNDTIRYCYLEGLGTGNDGIAIHANYPGTLNVGVNNNVYGNEVHDFGENAIDLTAFNGGQVYDNIFDSDWLTVYISYSATNVHFHHNYIYGCDTTASGGAVGILCDGPVYFYNNIITTDSNGYTLLIIQDASDGTATHHPNNINIYGNTFIHNGGTYCIRLMDAPTHGALGVCRFRYNIITSRTAALPNVFTFSNTTYKYNDADFNSVGNCIYDPASDPHFVDTDGAITWATWIAAHIENSKDDPLLVNRTGSAWTDWKLNSISSPAYGTASWPTTGDTYYKKDGTGAYYYYIDDLDGTTPLDDCGAYQYVGSAPSGGTCRMGGPGGFGGSHDFGR